MSTTVETVRLEYLGANRGPIPYRTPSGRTYRAASETYRFINALPEDADFLVATRKFRRVQVVETQPTPEPVTTVESEPAPVDVGPMPDVSSVAALRESLAGGEFSAAALQAALDDERARNKPRATVIKLLSDAIPDTDPGDL